MVIARGCGGVEWVKVQEGIGGELNGDEKKKEYPEVIHSSKSMEL